MCEENKMIIFIYIKIIEINKKREIFGRNKFNAPHL